ncbi:unnamed protein product, partial [Ectocarpus sp. 13 AM-2016]
LPVTQNSFPYCPVTHDDIATAESRYARSISGLYVGCPCSRLRFGRIIATEQRKCEWPQNRRGFCMHVGTDEKGGRRSCQYIFRPSRIMSIILSIQIDYISGATL